MKKLFLFLVVTLIWGNLFAQLQNRVWVFGRPISGSANATLYFGDLSNPVVNLPIGQPDHISTSNGSEQWAVITNSITGDLIFYTDGKNVFDNQNNLVSGADLGGNVSSSQPVAIAPVPKDIHDLVYNTYYIFSNETGAFPSSCDLGTITYRIYDAQSHGFGSSQNLPGTYGTSNVTEGMKIIPCDSSSSILWLVVSLFPDAGNETKYVVYKIFKNIVTYQGDYNMGPVKTHLPGGASCSPILDIAYTKANTVPGITTVGFAVQYSSEVFTCQFDNLNGQFLTNTVKECNTGYSGSIPSVYNLEFSPNGRFLYYSVYASTGSSNNELYQVDLNDAVLTPTLINTFGATYGGGLKLGPDSLIYHISDNGVYTNTLKLGRIKQPDVKFIPGTTTFSQFYEENFKTYPNVMGVGLCEFLVLPTTFLPNGISEKQQSPDAVGISLYPNPASDVVSINIANRKSENYTLTIYDISGRIIHTEKVKQLQTQINTSKLSNGMYMLEIKSEGLSKIQKLAIQR